MKLPPYLRADAAGVQLAVKAQPRASMNQIGEATGAELKIRIAAPPVDSAANDELVRFLSDLLECPRSSVQLIRGATSRHKVLLIRGLCAEAIAKRLADSSR